MTAAVASFQTDAATHSTRYRKQHTQSYGVIIMKRRVSGSAIAARTETLECIFLVFFIIISFDFPDRQNDPTGRFLTTRQQQQEERRHTRNTVVIFLFYIEYQRKTEGTVCVCFPKWPLNNLRLYTQTDMAETQGSLARARSSRLYSIYSVYIYISICIRWFLKEPS